MGNRKSIASVLLFVGSLLCFFLPFVTVSCGGEKIFTLSGQQMATGTTIEQPQPFGPAKEQKIDADPFAAIAALCAIVGVILSLAGTRLAAGAAVTGVAGAASLGVMASRMSGQIHKATQGMGTANEEIGFTMTVCLLIAASAWNVYLLIQNRKTEHLPVTAVDQPLSNAQVRGDPLKSPPAPAAMRCRNCGRHLENGPTFCEECGAKIG